MKNPQKVQSGHRFLWQETMNVIRSDSLGKVVFWGLCRIQTLKITYMSYLDKVFESLTEKIQSFQRLKNFRRFRVFVLIYKAIRKEENNGKFPIWLNFELFYGSFFLETVMFFAEKSFFSLV